MTSRNLMRRYLSLMTRIRVAEEMAANYFLENKIFSFVHFAAGQEYAASAIGLQVAPEDYFIGNHRSHHHFLAKGGSPYEMFAEMLGKSTGCAKGRGGSMHMFDARIGFLGTSPILSSALPISLGAAKSQKENGTSNIVVAFTGDGATEEGNFYECLNFLSLWQLPMIIVIEDNKYAVNSLRSSRRSDNFSFRNLSHSFGLDFHTMESNNPIGAIDVAREAIDNARENRPSVILASMTRFFAHSSPLQDDNAKYRIENMELEKSKLDPISLVFSQLLLSGENPDILESTFSDAHSEMEKALFEAIDAPAPLASELFDGLYEKIH